VLEVLMCACSEAARRSLLSGNELRQLLLLLLLPLPLLSGVLGDATDVLYA